MINIDEFKKLYPDCEDNIEYCEKIEVKLVDEFLLTSEEK